MFNEFYIPEEKNRDLGLFFKILFIETIRVNIAH